MNEDVIQNFLVALFDTVHSSKPRKLQLGQVIENLSYLQLYSNIFSYSVTAIFDSSSECWFEK